MVVRERKVFFYFLKTTPGKGKKKTPHEKKLNIKYSKKTPQISKNDCKKAKKEKRLNF